MRKCEICSTPIPFEMDHCPSCGCKIKKSSPIIEESKEVVERKPKKKVKLGKVLSVVGSIIFLYISISQVLNLNEDSLTEVYVSEWEGDSLEELELNYPELVDHVRKYYDYLDAQVDGIAFLQQYKVYKKQYDTLGDRYVEIMFEAGIPIEGEEIHIVLKKSVMSANANLNIFSDHGTSPDQLNPDILQVYAKVSGEKQSSIQLVIDEYDHQNYKSQVNNGDWNLSVHYYTTEENQLRTALDLVKNLKP